MSSRRAVGATTRLTGDIEIGSSTSRDLLIDCLLLLALGLMLIATGIGLRDPWPADEPRFALIARDMALSGDWLLPRVGGDVYADKPPLYFWLMAALFQLTGSLRAAFLIPSLLSALACVLLIYDLARRLWNRETGLLAGALLLLTVQFVWQARQAQIDATLCFWTTLSLYGLLRHLLLGPQWRWYVIGWVAAGFGVITKGVGFLPLLILVPFALLRGPSWSLTYRDVGNGDLVGNIDRPRMAQGSAMLWISGPLAFLLAIAVWLVPMLLAASSDPRIAVYRDEILFHQTLDRYANAWQHREPFWYFIVNVIPLLWLPLTAMLPWLVPSWRRALRARDLRIALLLAWVAIVVLFFSVSPGKRGVYVLPAVPALVLACAPYTFELLAKKGIQRALFAIAVVIGVICTIAVAYVSIREDKRAELISSYGLDPLGPAALIACAALLICVITRPARGAIAYASVLASVLLVVSFWVNPVMNPTRSGQAFARRIEQLSNPAREIGIVAFNEQYLLQLRRPIVHFGHARWREREQEAFDAARWLSEDPHRQLIVTDYARTLCFPALRATDLGEANRIHWFLVEGAPLESCVARGRSGVALTYAASSAP
jgi:4-amino-4-deoxy-L-arabinose transferase-like glycosyltransferase